MVISMLCTVEDLRARLNDTLLEDLSHTDDSVVAIEVSLASAEGEVLAALIGSGRYTRDYLESVQDPTIIEFIKDIVCALAIRNLVRYKLHAAQLESLEPIWAEAEKLVRDIWLGRRNLPISDAVPSPAVFPKHGAKQKPITLRDRLTNLFPN